MEGSPLRQRETLFPAEPALSAERPAAEKLEAIETPLSSMGEEPAETGRLPGTGAAEKVAKGIADRKQKKVDRLSSWLSAYKKQKKS
jgi:hypothetical protein